MKAIRLLKQYSLLLKHYQRYSDAEIMHVFPVANNVMTR